MSKPTPMTEAEKLEYWRGRVARRMIPYITNMNSDYKAVIDMMRHMGIPEDEIASAVQLIDQGWNTLATLVNTHGRKPQ